MIGRSHFRRSGGVIFTLVISAGVASAAIPPLSKEDLNKQATHILVGDVRAVYTTEKPGERGFTDRLYCIEVVPTALEKGEGLKEGRVIYARAWTPAKRPRGWTGGQGQNVIPEAGKRVRVYLAQAKDGGLDLVEPNGLEVTREGK
jgi:hypothetical protein